MLQALLIINIWGIPYREDNTWMSLLTIEWTRPRQELISIRIRQIKIWSCLPTLKSNLQFRLDTRIRLRLRKDNNHPRLSLSKTFGTIRIIRSRCRGKMWKWAVMWLNQIRPTIQTEPQQCKRSNRFRLVWTHITTTTTTQNSGKCKLMPSRWFLLQISKSRATNQKRSKGLLGPFNKSTWQI